MTPNQKHLGKAVARRSNKKIAIECLRDKSVRKEVLKLVRKEIHAEIKTLCSRDANSILQKTDSLALKLFKWKTLTSELNKYTPILKSLLECTGVRHRNRHNFDAVVGLCVALLARNRNHKMNLIAKMFSLIMYAGHIYSRGWLAD